jgi:DNA phosphorothioation-dependent restriction protein DptG
MSTAHYINALTRMNSTVRDLFIYLYNLSPLELDILLTLITKSTNNNKNFMTLEELTRELDRDKSTVLTRLQTIPLRSWGSTRDREGGHDKHKT